MVTFILYVSELIIAYFFLLGAWYGLTLLTAFPDVWKTYKEILYGDLYKLLDEKSDIPLTIVMPVYNEEDKILNAIYGILQSNYKNVQIMVVLDGSTDHTLDILSNEFELYEIPPVVRQIIKTQPIRNVYKSQKLKNLTVIYKEHSPPGNGADSINCGLNALTTPIYLTVDADTILEPNGLTAMLFSFLSHKHTILVAGCCYVLNENNVENGRLLTREIPKKLVPAFQSLEYLRSFTYGRTGLNAFAGVMCSPGAFTLAETYIVRETGGYNSKNFAYDTEITLAMHDVSRAMKYPTKIMFMPTAVSWTEVPGTLKRFWKQRAMWQRGMIRSIFNHKRMFFNPRYGVVGMLTFPIFVALDVFSPVIEFTSYFLFVLALYFNLFNLQSFLWFILLAWGFIIIMSIFSFYLDLITAQKYKDFTLSRLIWLVTIEMFGFRQFRAAACAYGTVYYIYRRLTGNYL